MSWALFLSFSLLAVFVEAIFAFFEMASVSFNKIRLQYYVSQGNRRAIWLDHLLKRPSRLFGTTLIGANAALQLGSECSRRFYEALHLNPDWAPLTQVLLVVIFAELVPLFAAMRHPEQVAMFLVPLMAVFSKLFTPLIWIFDALSQLGHRIMKKPAQAQVFLSREEVKMAFSEKEKHDEITRATSQIFKLKGLTAGDLMISLNRVPMAPSSATVEEVKHLITTHYAPHILIYHRLPHNVVGLLYLRDLLRLEEKKRILEYARSPWFVAKGAPLLSILDQFRKNKQSVALILDSSGQVSGFLTLDAMLSQIFGEEAQQRQQETSPLYIERTLSGEMRIQEFNCEFGAALQGEAEETLSELITRHLGHFPTSQETIEIDAYQFTVNEPSLRGIRVLSVRSLQE